MIYLLIGLTGLNLLGLFLNGTYAYYNVKVSAQLRDTAHAFAKAGNNLTTVLETKAVSKEDVETIVQDTFGRMDSPRR